MRRVNFDYGNTCPKIDKAIGQAKANIESFIDDLLSDACGLLPEKTRKELAADYASDLYNYIEDAFENVRSTNEDMRDAADDQISDLKDRIEELEGELRARGELE
jgi:predicted nuclease with TOPRIM domain